MFGTQKGQLEIFVAGCELRGHFIENTLFV
jgi:hypothetical protein